MHSMQADSKKPRSTSSWSKEVDIALVAHWLSKKKLKDFSYDGAGTIKPDDIKNRMRRLRSKCPSMKALQKKSLKSFSPDLFNHCDLAKMADIRSEEERILLDVSELTFCKSNYGYINTVGKLILH